MVEAAISGVFVCTIGQAPKMLDPTLSIVQLTSIFYYNPLNLPGHTVPRQFVLQKAPLQPQRTTELFSQVELYPFLLV